MTGTIATLPLLAWSPLQFDAGAMIWTWVVFGVGALILYRFAWGPLLGALEARETKVRDSLEEAERAREDARRLSEEFDEKIRQAQLDATRMAEEARASAEKLSADIESQARERAENLIERARQEVALAQRQALEEVRELAVDLSLEAAGAVLKKSVDKDDNRKLASNVIKMVKRGGTGS